jgi:hypothetical protein
VATSSDEGRMTTDDHATHALSARIRALYGTSPSKGLLDALAFEAENLERRLDDAKARIAGMLEDDGTEAEAPARVQPPASAPSSSVGGVFTHG